jgi:hypothetical protein
MIFIAMVLFSNTLHLKISGQLRAHALNVAEFFGKDKKP